MKGRPSKYSIELVTELCERLATSERGLVKICREDADMPKPATIYHWLKQEDKQDLRNMVKKARLGAKPRRPTFGKQATGFDDYRIANASKSNSKKFPNGYIYVIHIEDTDYYKFGVSQNLSRRLKDLRSATPFKLNLLYSCVFNDVYDIESTIHSKIREFYVKSEWFKMKKDIVDSIIEELNSVNIRELQRYGEGKDK